MKRHNFQYLDDSAFLKKFDEIKIKTQHIKIILLNYDEKPIEEIQGRVLSGSFTFDGSSSMRRTCNLTMIADNNQNDLTNIQNLISINKKVDVLIGFDNITDKYKDYSILWFPQGLYLITNAGISKSNSGVQISLTLHDKMALLNGQCGGTFPAPVTFHQKEEEDEDGITQITNPTIFQIIQQLMNHFGKEPLHKIIISDVNEKAKSPFRWNNTQKNLYLYESVDAQDQIQYKYTTDKEKNIYRTFKYGDIVGYKLVDAIFPKQLVAKPGDTITTILDQIKNTLGNYEYFYDIDGNFIFQEIKNYLNNTYVPNLLQNDVKHSAKGDYYGGKPVYSFTNANLIQSFNNNPQYQQVKNDFVIWGKRKNNNGTSTDIRYHVAIDEQPSLGSSYQVYFQHDDSDDYKKTIMPLKYNYKSDFPKKGKIGKYYYAEKEHNIYRYIYSNDEKIKKEYKLLNTSNKGHFELKDITSKDYRTQLYLSGMQSEILGIDKNDYYVELKEEWQKIYDVENECFFPEIVENQDKIQYFLDLLNNEGTLAQFSIKNIGRRTVVINDDSINCIFQPEIEDIYIIQKDNQEQIEACKDRKLTVSLVSQDIYNQLLTNFISLKSAYQKMRAQLHQYISYNNQVTISTIPIYHLQPNTRIEIKDIQTGIYGDFMIKSISLPMKAGDVMNITCIKATERI